MSDPLLTVPQVAAQLGVHPNTVYKIAADGSLRSCRLSPQVLRFRQQDIDAFVDRSMT